MATVGILGGMGPEAAGVVFQKLVEKVPAEKDSDHPKVVLLSYPQIPDRTAAIMGTGPSPVTAIVRMAKDMERLFVETACLACITAHYFFDEIQSSTTVRLLNAVKEMVLVIQREYSERKTIGVLATSGTVKGAIFDKYSNDLKFLYPKDHVQDRITESIYGKRGIKRLGATNHSKIILETAVEHLVDRGADLVIAGCTEIPLVLQNEYKGTAILDPMDVVVRKLIEIMR